MVQLCPTKPVYLYRASLIIDSSSQEDDTPTGRDQPSNRCSQFTLGVITGISYADTKLKGHKFVYSEYWYSPFTCAPCSGSDTSIIYSSSSVSQLKLHQRSQEWNGGAQALLHNDLLQRKIRTTVPSSNLYNGWPEVIYTRHQRLWCWIAN